MGTYKDLTGQRFGRLLVIEKTEQRQGGEILWRCVCDCGTTKLVRGSHLRNGKTMSCSCLIYEKGRNQTHGLRRTRLYDIWSNLKGRCDNPKNKCYHNYGGRGITYCKEWEHFEPFWEWAMANGYRSGLTIDRIDNSKGYCPENCRWATIKEQARNRRTNHLLTYKGETKTITEWAEQYNIPPLTLQARVARYHWPVETAIETPVRKRKAPTKYEDNAEA